jgi:hypothetical protein
VVGDPIVRESGVSVGSVESVIRLRRFVVDEKNGETKPSNTDTFVHLRAQSARAGEAPLTVAGYNSFRSTVAPILNPGGAPIPDGAIFFQGQGEFALAVSSSAQLHVPGYLRSALAQGEVEQGIIRLKYSGPGPAGRFVFSLHDPDKITDPSVLQPVTLELPPSIEIQTLTKASATPADLTPRAVFRALLERGGGPILVRSLVEVAPSAEADVVSLDAPDRITLRLAEAPDPLLVEVHPKATTVEYYGSASAALALSGGSDSSEVQSKRIVRGPWAEQGLRLQVGDRCEMEFVAAAPGSGVKNRVSLIKIKEHDPALVLFGSFLPDDAPDALKDDDFFGETVFSFQPLGSSQPARRLTIDDSVRIVSGPTMPDRSWRYRQGPPPPGVLTKIFLAASPPQQPDLVALPVRAIEILNGLQGRNLTARKPVANERYTFHLTLPGYSDTDEFVGHLSDALGPILSGDSFPPELGKVDVSVRFLQDDIAGEVQFTYAGTIQKNPWAVPFESGAVFHLDHSPWPLDIPEEPGAVVEMTITWTTTVQADGADKLSGPVVTVTRIVRPKVQVQFLSWNPELRRAEVQVVFREGAGTPLESGTRTALYLESAGPNDPLAYMQPRIAELKDSGLPLDIEVQETMVVETDKALIAASPSVNQWSLFAWPATAGLLNDKPNSLPPTRIRSGSLATLYSKRDPRLFLNEPSPTDPDAFYRLVADKRDDGSWQVLTGASDPARSPSVGGPPLTFVQKQVVDRFPDGVHFLPDQIIVDDAIAHWWGRSLAVGLPGKAGLRSGRTASEPENEALKLFPSIPHREAMPLRFGWSYGFRLRPMYLTGHVPDADEIDDREVIVFHPFAGSIEPLHQTATSSDQRQDSSLPAHSVPFQRLDPLPPPRVGWPKRAQEPKDGRFHRTNRWGEPIDVHLLTAGPASATATHAAAGVSREFPELIVHAPEASFRIAEQTGLLDYAYHSYHIGAFVEGAARELYRLIRDRDRPLGELLPGYIPERLPDSDSDHFTFELRRFGEASAKTFDLPGIPGFGTSNETWIRNHFTTHAIPIHVMPDPPPAGFGQKENGITVGLRNGQIFIYLPTNFDCELTLRSVPTKDAAGHLALTWLLEAIVQQLAQQAPGAASPPLSAVTNAEDKLKAAREGHHPVLSPGVTIRLRHMTARPARPPEKIALLMAERLPGGSRAVFDGRYRIDRPSTGTLRVQAAMEMAFEDNPDSALPQVTREELMRILPREYPVDTSPNADATASPFFGFSSDDRQAIITNEFAVTQLVPIDPSRTSPAAVAARPPIPQLGGEIEQIRYEHELGDTRHRTVYYRPLAVSRFEQYYPEAERQLNPFPGRYRIQNDPDAGVRWDRVEIPATTRPDRPAVVDQNVVFELDPSWTEPRAAWSRAGGRWAFMRTRRSGVRLWLARPWYTSGSGEKLAVVCWGHTRLRKGAVERYLRVVSRWGTDPLFEQDLGPETDMGVITRADFTHADPNSVASMAIPPASTTDLSSSVSLKQVPVDPGPPPAIAPPAFEDPMLALAVHHPKFHPDARLWYCDVFVRPRQYTPFVSLSVVRYQPFSLPTCAVSQAVRVDPVQLQPPRTLHVEVMPRGILRLKLTLTGIFPPSLKEDRRLILCRLERFPARLRSDGSSPFVLPDLGWEAVGLAEEETQLLATDTASNYYAREIAIDSVRHFLPGLQLIPSESGGQISYGLEFDLRPQTGWTAADALRLVVEEHELYPAAYALAEGRTWAPRLIYTEHVVFFSELIRLLFAT